MSLNKWTKINYLIHHKFALLLSTKSPQWLPRMTSEKRRSQNRENIRTTAIMVVSICITLITHNSLRSKLIVISIPISLMCTTITITTTHKPTLAWVPKVTLVLAEMKTWLFLLPTRCSSSSYTKTCSNSSSKTLTTRRTGCLVQVMTSIFIVASTKWVPSTQTRWDWTTISR